MRWCFERLFPSWCAVNGCVFVRAWTNSWLEWIATMREDAEASNQRLFTEFFYVYQLGTIIIRSLFESIRFQYMSNISRTNRYIQSNFNFIIQIYIYISSNQSQILLSQIYIPLNRTNLKILCFKHICYWVKVTFRWRKNMFYNESNIRCNESKVQFIELYIYFI